MKVGSFGNAVIKTTVIVLYYIIVGVLNLLAFAYFEANQEVLTQLVICNSIGGQECDTSAQTTNQVLNVVGPVSHALIPAVVAILFGCNLNYCSKKKNKSFTNPMYAS